jgi:hypothetical protein
MNPSSLGKSIIRTPAQQYDSWDCCAHVVLCSPLTHTYPASKFWGINASFKYGNDSCSAAILNSTAGFVDTGTTLIGLAPGRLLRDSDFYPNMWTESYHLRYVRCI